MKTKFSKEDLVYSLPDYISDKSMDKELSDLIRNEIENNAEFKNEFDELRSSMNFLKTAKLESPGDSYFNNLSVRINDRVNAVTNENIWNRISIFWKILVPALTIILIAVFYYTNFKSNYKPENQVVQQEQKNNPQLSEKQNQNNDGNKNLLSQQNSDEQLSTKKSSVKESNENVSYIKKYKKSINTPGPLKANQIIQPDQPTQPVIQENMNSDLIADNVDKSEGAVNDADEDLLITKDNPEEDNNLDDEIKDLTPEQQKEILETLSKSQI